MISLPHARVVTIHVTVPSRYDDNDDILRLREAIEHDIREQIGRACRGEANRLLAKHERVFPAQQTRKFPARKIVLG